MLNYIKNEKTKKNTMTTKKKPKKVIVKAWAGILDGKIDKGWIEIEKFTDSCHGIFSTKKEAKQYYEKVLPVKITYII